jgi:hypothetical protein
MKEYLIELIGIACAVVIVMSQAKWYAWFVEKIGGLKPFSCELCMSFWIYLFYSLYTNGPSVETFLSAFICSYIAYLLSTKLLKW